MNTGGIPKEILALEQKEFAQRQSLMQQSQRYPIFNGIPNSNFGYSPYKVATAKPGFNGKK